MTRKGKTNNPNGRPKGKPNKVAAEMRKWVQQLIDGNRPQHHSCTTIAKQGAFKALLFCAGRCATLARCAVKHSSKCKQRGVVLWSCPACYLAALKSHKKDHISPL